MNCNVRPIEILLVEDNEGDIFLIESAFRDGSIANNIHVARDGEQAVAMLQKEAEYTDMIMPDIILLDINLPKLNGQEVLYKIKRIPEVKRIPVIVLSSSKSTRDIHDMYDLQASGYITKPVSVNEFKGVVQAIEHFWFGVVVLPTKAV